LILVSGLGLGVAGATASGVVVQSLQPTDQANLSLEAFRRDASVVLAHSSSFSGGAARLRLTDYVGEFSATSPCRALPEICAQLGTVAGGRGFEEWATPARLPQGERAYCRWFLRERTIVVHGSRRSVVDQARFCVHTEPRFDQCASTFLLWANTFEKGEPVPRSWAEETPNELTALLLGQPFAAKEVIR
jgi:hypothetical protein